MSKVNADLVILCEPSDHPTQISLLEHSTTTNSSSAGSPPHRHTLRNVNARGRLAFRQRGTLILLVIMGVMAVRLNPQMETLSRIASGNSSPQPKLIMQMKEETPNDSTSKTKAPLPTDNDNRKIPGLFKDDQLYILGARLTSSYDKFDTSLSFDMFGHGVGTGANKKHGAEAILPKFQLTFQEASREPLFCQVHGVNMTEQVRMEYIPNDQSYDDNTHNTHLIWRCNISPYISRLDLLESGKSHVRVSVYNSTIASKTYSSASKNKPILTVDVPLDTATVGHAGPMVKSSHTPSFLETIQREGPMGVVLCVAGLKKSSMWYLPEFIQHHLNVGVEQIFLGIDLVHQIPLFEEQLAYYIDQGLVVLGGDPVIPFGVKNPGYDRGEVRKMRFYNQCLYHAKGLSEFLAIWDVDELWVPPIDTYIDHSSLANKTYHLRKPNTRRHKLQHTGIQELKVDSLWAESPYSQALSLPEAARSMRGKNGCFDWCFQTFPSYTVQRVTWKRTNVTDPKLQGYFGFAVREKEMNHKWQKPIIRTKYAHQASFHLGGSCRRPKMPSRSKLNKDHDVNADKYSNDFQDCPFLWEASDAVGAMHHYFSLFRPQKRLARKRHYPNDNEYNSYFRTTTIEQLERLQDKVRAIEEKRR